MNNKVKEKFINFIKGFIIGGTMLVPGVSGGTMAMILGVYEELISSVSSFFKEKRKNFFFLLVFVIGAFLGMVLFSKSILMLLNKYHMPFTYFFLGAVVSGIPMIFKETEIKKFSFSIIFYILLGAAFVIGISFLPDNLLSISSMNSTFGMVMLFIAGFVAAIALVLPGISVSFVLLVLGIYEEIIIAIDTFNIKYLFILGIGLIVGIIGTTKILENAMTKHKKGTYLIILGFVIGSVIPIFPGFPSGINILSSIVTFTCGIGFIQLLYKLG